MSHRLYIESCDAYQGNDFLAKHMGFAGYESMHGFDHYLIRTWQCTGTDCKERFPTLLAWG